LRLPCMFNNGIVESATSLEIQAVVCAGFGVVEADLEVLYGFNRL
jgi:hypothetical protein